MSGEPSLMIVGPRHGRPPRAGVRSTNRIEFVVTDAEKEALKSVAADFGKSVAAIARDAIGEFVADYSERRIFKGRPHFE